MTNYEIEFLNKIRQSIPVFFDKLFKLITNLGGQEILILVILVVYFVFSKKIGQKLAYTIFASLLFNNSLKAVVNRVRPFNHPNANQALQDSQLSNATGQSFPSGHSQNSAVTYMSVAIAFKKNYLWIISSILIFLVGISRIMLGVHYPTDVVVGIALGIGFAFGGIKLFERFEDNFKNIMILYIVTALVFLPFAIIYFGRVTDGTEASYIAYKDLYTIYSFYLGFILAVYIEKKFVDFDESPSLKIRIIRMIGAMVIVVGLMFGLKAVFPSKNLYFDMIRYFMLSFIGLGIYPLIFKNILFKKSDE